MRRLRARDGRFVLLALVHAIGIAGFLAAGVGGDASSRGGWRRIDVDAVRAKIRAGDLVEHEAEWYRAVPDSEVWGP